MNMARELMVMLSFVALHTLWVLLPLIPAILIYRLFPNTSVTVSGPLSNLTVRASGAFAAYLVVFLATYPIVKTNKEAIGAFEHPFWTIRGHLKLVDADGKEITSEELVKKIELHLRPDFYNIESYSFNLRVDEPEPGNFPYVKIEIPGFGSGYIDLTSIRSEVSTDNYRKIIDLSKPIVVRQAGQALRLRPEGLPNLGPDSRLRAGDNPPPPVPQ